jgi:ribonuclease HI
MPTFSRPRTPALFPLTSSPPPDDYLIAHIDGGARGNPGPAGYGVAITNQLGHRVAGLSEYLGHQTNNFAEYSGLLAALQYAIKHGPKALKIVSDSELMVKQIRGEYKVKNLALQELYAKAKQLIAQLEWFTIGHVLREGNQEADRLANEAMDKGMGRRSAATASPAIDQTKEYEGVVRGGVIKLDGAPLPDGTRVQIRIKK